MIPRSRSTSRWRRATASPKRHPHTPAIRVRARCWRGIASARESSSLNVSTSGSRATLVRPPLLTRQGVRTISSSSTARAITAVRTTQGVGACCGGAVAVRGVPGAHVVGGDLVHGSAAEPGHEVVGQRCRVARPRRWPHVVPAVQPSAGVVLEDPGEPGLFRALPGLLPGGGEGPRPGRDQPPFVGESGFGVHPGLEPARAVVQSLVRAGVSRPVPLAGKPGDLPEGPLACHPGTPVSDTCRMRCHFCPFTSTTPAA
jgi:hypothetical protein